MNPKDGLIDDARIAALRKEIETIKRRAGIRPSPIRPAQGGADPKKLAALAARVARLESSTEIAMALARTAIGVLAEIVESRGTLGHPAEKRVAAALAALVEENDIKVDKGTLPNLKVMAKR